MTAPEPDAYRDAIGGIWANLRKHPFWQPGVQDPDEDTVPLYLTEREAPVSEKIFICQTDGKCPEHGPFIYYCYECHLRPAAKSEARS